MATLSPAQIYALARNAGLDLSPALIATAVALAESGGRTDAMGDLGLQNATWGPSVGLWQIRSLKSQSGTGQPRDATKLTDPVFNAKSMASISGTGSNFGPWSTFNNGSYKNHISAVIASLKANPGAADPSSIGTWLQNAAVGVVGGATDAAGSVAGAVSKLNPFANWQTDVLDIGLKIGGVIACGALLIVGAKQTFNSGE